MTTWRDGITIVFILVATCALPWQLWAQGRGRPYLDAARTTFMGDNGQLIRGAFTSTEWTPAVPEAEIAKIKDLGFNAVHLYA